MPGDMPDLSSNQYDQIKQALEAINNKGSDSGPSGQDFQMMLGALAMKREQSNLPPEMANHHQMHLGPPPPIHHPPPTTQVDEKMAKSKLVKQMRLTLQNKYHVMYYMKEIRELLMMMEIQFNRLANYADNEVGV